MVRKYSLRFDGDKKVSEHFKVKEFACKDLSDTILIDDDLIEMLESARQFLGKPIKVVSGYRTESYNKSVGGATKSYHVKGMAADVSCETETPSILACYLAATGARGIMIYKNWVHVDTREDRYIKEV